METFYYECARQLLVDELQTNRSDFFVLKEA
jgi:hypothetical protein